MGAAEWDGRVPRVVEATDAERPALERILRMTPVVAHDPTRLPAGTSGPLVVEPGDYDWFLLAARVRAEQEGLTVRFTTATPGGWDPAGSYRRMGEWVARREARS